MRKSGAVALVRYHSVGQIVHSWGTTGESLILKGYSGYVYEVVYCI
jgi:hypothetical protein